MPTFDYICDNCGAFAEDAFFKISEKPDIVPCPVCEKTNMRQVPAIGIVIGDEAAWLQSVTNIVDPDGGIDCQRFRKYPTRDNYDAWMKNEGLRPLENGEGAISRKTEKQNQEEKSRRVTKLVQNHQKRMAITVQ
jgi:putative FmdB family regulatory protein